MIREHEPWFNGPSDDSDLTSSDESTLSSGSAIELNDVHHRAQLYIQAAPRTIGIANKSSKRTTDKIIQGLLSARAALLLQNWANLLATFQILEKGMKKSSSITRLGWRLPILVEEIYPERRSLSTKDARAVISLRQRLSASSAYTHCQTVVARIENCKSLIRAGESTCHAAFVDSLELALLSEGNAPCLDLSRLGLLEIPEFLLLAEEAWLWYGQFGDLPHLWNDFCMLNLSHNSIETFPQWLPNVMPHLQVLNLQGNWTMKTVPPSIVSFKDLKTLVVPNTLEVEPNVLGLVHQASAILDSIDGNHTPSVSSLLRLSLQLIQEQDLEHLPYHWRGAFERSYHCTSCSAQILPSDPTYLETEVRERIFLFDPPFAAASASQQIIEKTPFIVGGDSWRFCADCLCGHLRSRGNCQCILCQSEAGVLARDEPIRWARKMLVD